MAEPSSSVINAAALVPLGSHAQKPSLPLTRLVTLAGSEDRCHLRLVSSTVSRQHALILCDGAGGWVRDLASRTGVFVNDRKIRESPLKDGDDVRIGKFAFRFAAGQTFQAAQPPPVAALTLVGRTDPFPLDSRTALIGREADCDIPIAAEVVSARHAVIFHADGKRYLRDLNSRTGTYLNGSRIHQHEIHLGDQIGIGEVRLELVLPTSASDAQAPLELAPAPPAPAEPIAPAPPAQTQELVIPLQPLPTEKPLPPPQPQPHEVELPLAPLPLAEAPAVDEAPVAEAPPLQMEPPVAPAPTQPQEEEIPLAPLPLAEAPAIDEAPVAEAPPLEMEPPVAPALPPPQEEETPLAPLPLAEAPAVDQAPEPEALPVEMEQPVASAQPPGEQDVEPLADQSEALQPAATPEPAAAMPEAQAAPPDFQLDAQPPEVEVPLEAAHQAPEAGGVEVHLTADHGVLMPEEAGHGSVVDAEVLQPPEPSPQATIDLDLALPAPPEAAPSAAQPVQPTPSLESPAPLEPSPPQETPAAEEQVPTDTQFGRIVEQFIGEASGPLVEDEPAAAATSDQQPVEPAELTISQTPMSPEPGPSADELPAEPLVEVEPTAAATSDQQSVEPAELTISQTPISPEPGPSADELPPLPLADELPAEPLAPATPETSATAAVDMAPLAEVEATPDQAAADVQPPPAPAPLADAAQLAEPPVPAAPPSAPRGFSLDDGFFNADLAAVGVFIHTDMARPPQPSAPNFTAGEPAPPAPDAPAATPPPPVGRINFIASPLLPTMEGFGAVADQMKSEAFFGGAPVQLTKPQPPPRNYGQVEVSFDAPRPAGPTARPPEAKSRPSPRRGSDALPTPPPKARSVRATPTPFGTKRLGAPPDDDDEAPEDPNSPSPQAAKDTQPPNLMAFDGLALPVRDAFSDLETAPLNDAAFGGARLSHADDYVLPETPQAAARLGDEPDPDFANDEFWNRTDEQDDLPPMGIPQPEDYPAADAPAPAAPPLETPATQTPPTDSAPTQPEVATEEQGELPPAAQSPAPAGAAPPELPAAPPEPPAAAAKPKKTPPPRRRPPVVVPTPPPPAVEDPDETWTAIPVASEAPQTPAEVAQPAALEEEAAPPPPPAPQPPPASAGRRWGGKRVVPLLMLAMLLSMGIVMAAIWLLVSPKSRVVGSLTYVNLDWVPRTEDGSAFEALQRRLLDGEQTHNHARQILQQIHPQLSPGFLSANAVPYLRVTSTMKLSSTRIGGVAQTVMQVAALGSDQSGDRERMSALLQALIDANAPVLDDNRRSRDVAQRARAEVDDAQAKIEQLKTQIASLQRLIAQEPPAAAFAELTARKQQLQKTRFDAEDVVERDRVALQRLQSGPPAEGDDAAATQPSIVDPQLDQMRREMAELDEQLAAAKSQQSAGIAQARAQLEAAAKQFNDQLAAAGGLLDNSSQLKQFVDSAKDAQSKAHQLILTLIVDGEDLEKQLEDTRRDVEEMIQARQQQKWAADPQLLQLQLNLDGAQHRYNAAVGEGVRDPKLLDALQKEIDQWTEQIKSRQSQLGLDSREVKVADGLNKVIESLRRKLQKEKQQIDEVLDPLDQQLANLEAALPDAQQHLAQDLRQRLKTLNDARRQYADAVGEGQASPSARVTELQKQMDDLKGRFDRRQRDLTQQMRPALGDQRGAQLAEAQKQLDADKLILEDAKQAYDRVRVEYDQQAGHREDAASARARIAELTDELQNRTSQLDLSIRDRDQKQAQANRSFDIQPLADADITGTQVDPRRDYCLYAIPALAILFAILTYAASRHGSADSHRLHPQPA